MRDADKSKKCECYSCEHYEFIPEYISPFRCNLSGTSFFCYSIPEWCPKNAVKTVKADERDQVLDLSGDLIISTFPAMMNEICAGCENFTVCIVMHNAGISIPCTMVTSLPSRYIKKDKDE